jgi:8-hydroxy-5-deazaflavin:NADPH oxidoreductase
VPAPAPVTIVGATGNLGFGLALRLGRAGVAVTIGSRDAGRAHEAAARAAERVPEGTFAGAANADAVASGATVILSVPFASQAEMLKGLKDAFSEGQLLIDATVPLATAAGGRPFRMLGVWQGSAAQQAAELVPDGVRVVSAFHSVAAATLEDLEHELDEDVLVCGDRKADKREAAQLVELIPGLRAVDAGRLEMSRIAESLTALLIGINGRYKTHAGLKLTALPDERWPA